MNRWTNSNTLCTGEQPDVQGLYVHRTARHIKLQTSKPRVGFEVQSQCSS
jgi:hypothetical protein